MAWLNSLRVTASFSVVLLHTAAIGLNNSEVFSINWHVSNIINGSVRWCVPVFVLLSGYLLIKPNHIDTYNKFYKKRLNKILVPVIFWSIFYCSWKFLNHPDITLLTAMKGMLNGSPYYHMWYLYMIVGLYLFVPFLNDLLLVLNKNKSSLLIIFMFILLTTSTLLNSLRYHNESPFYLNFLIYIPFYCLGAHFKLHGIVFKSMALVSTSFMICTIVIIFGYFYFINFGFKYLSNYFYNYCSPFTIITSISIFILFSNKIKVSAKTASLSKMSLGIYLIHPIFLDLIYNIAPTAFFKLGGLLLPIIAIIVFFMSYASSFILSKIRYVKNVI